MGLLGLALVLGAVDCMTTVLFYPVAERFTDKCVTGPQSPMFFFFKWRFLKLEFIFARALHCFNLEMVHSAARRRIAHWRHRVRNGHGTAVGSQFLCQRTDEVRDKVIIAIFSFSSDTTNVSST